MKMKPLLAIMALTLLAGCNLTKDEYAAWQQLLRGSPVVKQNFIKDCTTALAKKHASPAKSRHLAGLTNSSVSAAPRVACQRFAAAAASGRMSYADYLSGADDRVMTPGLIKIIQGH